MGSSVTKQQKQSNTVKHETTLTQPISDVVEIKNQIVSACSVQLQQEKENIKEGGKTITEKSAATVIQRHFRKRLTQQSINMSSSTNEFGDNDVITTGHQESSFLTDSFEILQSEVEETKWLAERQIETAVMDNGFHQAKTLVLVSSNVRSSPDKLKLIGHSNVEVALFDFGKNTLNDLLNSITLYLNQEVQGTKLRSIAFVLQGGPGFIYMCKNIVFTTPKVAKSVDLRIFLQSLGDLMSKLHPQSCTIDFIVKDLFKDGSGNLLINTIQGLMHPNKVHVRGVGDISDNSLSMIEKYFETTTYKCWYQERYIRKILRN